MRLRALNILLLFMVALIVYSCTRSETPSKIAGKIDQRKVQLVIDWQPSPEYYGIFYAIGKGYYADAGYDVTIIYGNGAPTVAAEVAAGAVPFGTTTSDNLVRMIAKGAKYTSATPLIAFNPSVLVTLKSSKVTKLSEVRGKLVGTNPEASVYKQFLSALRTDTLSSAGVREDPTIGWSGNVQLMRGKVDGILAYTTNIAVDLELSNTPINEIYLGDAGIHSYGVVLVAANMSVLKNVGLTESDAKQIMQITKRGYDEGCMNENLQDSVKFLVKADPTLKPQKVERAINKIKRLNSQVSYPLTTLDEWVEREGVSPETRQKAIDLYTKL